MNFGGLNLETKLATLGFLGLLIRLGSLHIRSMWMTLTLRQKQKARNTRLDEEVQVILESYREVNF
jgi:hypothetical protein